MPPKSKPDDIIEALLDKRVQDAITSNLSSSLNLMIEEILTKKLDVIMRSYNTLKQDNSTLKNTVVALEKANSELTAENKDFARRLSEQENHSRRENIIIRGLPEKSYSESAVRSSDVSISDMPEPGSSLSVEDTVVEFCRNSLKIDLDPRDISSAQRLRKTGKDTARPIMVRFVSLKVRDRVMRAKKVLRTSTDSHVFLSDHLTTEASQLFFEARTLVREKKLASAWTMNGRVYYKKTTAADEKPTLLLPGCLPN